MTASKAQPARNLPPTSTTFRLPGRPVSTTVFVVVVSAAMLLLRLVLMFEPLHSDEAGYLLVARGWHLGGPNLYGLYWVDRPPGLIALFKLASLSGWGPMVRVIAMPFTVVFVVSAAWAGNLVAGARAAHWSALLGAALMCTALLETQEADGELFAAPLVMLAVAMTLSAVRRSGWPSYRMAFGAGCMAGLAVTVKQNFGDAIIFAIVLVVVSLAQGRMRSKDALGVMVSGTVGGVLVLLACLGYAELSGLGVGEMWYDLFGFRTAAFDVLVAQPKGPLARLLVLLWLSVLSGIFPVAVLLLRQSWRAAFTGSPLSWAVAVTMLLETVGIIAGGSYWPHYLLQMAPMLVLAVARWIRDVPLFRGIVVFVVAASLFTTGWTALHPPTREGERLGAWIHRASRPHDTLTVLYGHEEVQYASALPSPYPYLWTLPMRTLDPHLALLRSLLSGPVAPTWVVVWSKVDLWALDRDDATRLELVTHYHLVDRECGGRQVWLLNGASRSVPGHPAC
jgi:hypothetical protein